MFWLLLPVAAVLAFLVLLGLLTIVVGSFEKLLVWPYVPIRATRPPHASSEPAGSDHDGPSEPDSSIPITEHFRAANLTAEQSGFTFLGAYRHGKGKIYRLRYNFWISTDRTVLAQTSTGTLAGIPMSITKFFTRLHDGRCLVTMDELRGRDTDLSGSLLQEVLTGSEFLELLDWHLRRLAGASQPAVPYSAKDPLGDHRAFRSEQANRLVERGLARFLDAERNVYKYTPRAATLVAIRPYLKPYRPSRSTDHGREVIAFPEPGQSSTIPAGRRAPNRTGILKNVEVFFWIVLGVGAVSTFSRGPAVNRAQAIFRASVSGIGLAGIVIVWLVKRRLAASAAREWGRSRTSDRLGDSTQPMHEIERGTWAEDDSPDRV